MILVHYFHFLTNWCDLRYLYYSNSTSSTSYLFVTVLDIACLLLSVCRTSSNSLSTGVTNLVITYSYHGMLVTHNTLANFFKSIISPHKVVLLSNGVRLGDVLKNDLQNSFLICLNRF